MYKDVIKEHAYQCAMSNLEDNYVPLDEFTAEQEKAEVIITFFFYPTVNLKRGVYRNSH